MGASMGICIATTELRELYGQSALLPLIGADNPEKVVQNARLKTAHEARALSYSHSQVTLVVDGCISLYDAHRKTHCIRVSRARPTTLTASTRPSRYSPDGASNSAVDESDCAHEVRTSEILLYWHSTRSIVCRYSCWTEGDEVVLKSILGSERVEFEPNTRYISLSFKPLMKRNGKTQSLHALMHADLVELISTIPFFSGVDRDKLVTLTELSTIRVFPPKSVIFQEDDSFSTQMFVTLAGTLEVRSSRASQPLATLEAGSFFGEMSLLMNIPRAATVTTCESCLLLSIEKQAFHTFLGTVPDLKVSVYEILKERLLTRALMGGVLPYLSTVPMQRLIEFSHQLTIEDHVRKGDCVMEHGAQNEKFGLVIYGVLEIMPSDRHHAGDGNGVYLTPGCYFGPFTFTRLTFVKGRVCARSPVVLLSCPFERLAELFREYPHVAAEAQIAWYGERCDLGAVLRHAVLTQRFQAFLEAEHSDENFSFCRDVETFRISIANERFQLANYILQQYIQPNAHREVNLPAAIRDPIAQLLKRAQPGDEIPVTVFDAANDEIMKLMSKDSFPRFKKSPMFQSVVDALDPHIVRKGSKLLDACHAFRESINSASQAQLEQFAVARLQRALSMIRKSSHRHRSGLVEPLGSKVIPGQVENG